MLYFYAVMFMCLYYIFQNFVNHPLVEAVYIVICLIVFILALIKLPVRAKMLTSFLFTSGVMIHFFYGNRTFELLDGITQNLALLSIILLAPLISIPLKQERIIERLVNNLKYVIDDYKRTYKSVFLLVFILSPILNMGSLRIVHSFIYDLKIPNRLLSKAYYNGFTPAILWSPFYASVGIVLVTADLSFQSYLPIGLSFATIQVLLAWMLFKGFSANVNSSKIKINGAFWLFVLYVFIILLLLVGLELLTGWSMLLLVSILCLSVPLIYQLIRFNSQEFLSEIKAYSRQVKSFSSMEVALFLSAGLFGSALLHTPIDDLLRNAILWSSEKSLVILFLFIILFVTVLAMVGIHQIVSVPIVLTVLLSLDLQMSMMSAAFMCIFTWMLSASISPLNALNIIISSCVRTNGIRVAYQWNGLYFITITSVAMIYVYVINVIY
ncbi:hypothetical protein [Piscibacillus salipiscarius]